MNNDNNNNTKDTNVNFGEKTFTLDVSKANNNEELFLNIVDATNGMVVTEIKLIGTAGGSSNGALNAGNQNSNAQQLANGTSNDKSSSSDGGRTAVGADASEE